MPSSLSDRQIHGWTADGGEVIRYDKAGKWWIEYPHGSLKPRRAVSVRGAAIAAQGIQTAMGGRTFRAIWHREHGPR